MKKLILLFSSILIAQYAHSQSIGIGANTTPDPSAVLDVNGTTKGFLTPRMTGVQRAAIPTPAVGLMVFQNNNSVVAPISSAGMYINTANGWKRVATADEIIAGSSSWTVSGVNQYNSLTGNVGIGTSTPSDKLDVRSYFRVSFDNDYIKLSSDFLGERLEFFEAGVEKASMFQSQGGIGFSTDGHVSHLRLFSSGNITTSSGSSFDIDGHTNTKATLTIDDDTPEIEFRDGAEVQASIKRLGASLQIGNNTALGGLSFRTQDIHRAQLESDGDFGINIPIANEKLHVGGNGLFTGNISADGNINSNSTMSINDPSGTFYLKNASVDKGFFQLSGENVRIGTVSANNTGNFIIRTNGADHVSVDENGNTTTKRLVVNQNLEAIKINGDDPAINFFESNIQKGYLWMVNNDMNLGTSNSLGKMYLNSSQINMQTAQVTIGTSIATPSTYKLGVGGRIICEELKVKLQSAGWPDYVFAKNYKLKSLDELENYIKINNHLPNIPTAQTIEKEGLEVGEMQRRMMEKIEELTLYIIDLKKEINQLKSPLTPEGGIQKSSY